MLDSWWVECTPLPFDLRFGHMTGFGQQMSEIWWSETFSVYVFRFSLLHFCQWHEKNMPWIAYHRFLLSFRNCLSGLISFTKFKDFEFGMSMLLSLSHDYWCRSVKYKRNIREQFVLNGRNQRNRFLLTMEVYNKKGRCKTLFFN